MTEDWRSVYSSTLRSHPFQLLRNIENARSILRARLCMLRSGQGLVFEQERAALSLALDDLAVIHAAYKANRLVE